MSMAPGQSRLVIIRGNSAGGKTSVAREVRSRYGRGIALIEQDHLRRVLLREHDSNGIDPAAPALVAVTARTALEHGFHTIVEGMMAGDSYRGMLQELITAHRGPSAVFYLDVSLPETIRRHRGRPETARVTDEQLTSWYVPGDLLGVPGEQVIGEASTFEQTVATILHDSGLASTAPLSACPARCPRCRAKDAAGS
jgi:predicted kinase